LDRDSIDADMRRNGGLITKEDLAKYQPWCEPIRTTTRATTCHDGPVDRRRSDTRVLSMRIMI
jgi:gamma-glutamyltranspeptidase